MRKKYCFSASLFVLITLAGCSTPHIPSGPHVGIDYGMKALQFHWVPVSGATHYNLLEDPDGASGYTKIGRMLTDYQYTHEIPLHLRVNASYRLEACNILSCSTSDETTVDADALAASIGYLKGSNTEADDGFGTAVAVSANGNTLAVGAMCEASGATGIDGDQKDNSAECSGAVYIYDRHNGQWSQQAYIKPENSTKLDAFGTVLALSADGNILAASDISGNIGAVYIFTRTGKTWAQQAKIKAFNPLIFALFGNSIGLSDDGKTLAVASLKGFAPDSTDTSDTNTEGVYIFTNKGAHWPLQAYITATDSSDKRHFGRPVALSGDGNTLVARRQDAVGVFTRSGTDWSLQSLIQVPNPEEKDRFGLTIALSADGKTLALGAENEDSAATGVNGDETDNSATDSGAVYVYTRSGDTWSRQAYLKASNTDRKDSFGSELALSADGNILVVSANMEAGGSIGINGDQADNSERESGAVYLFTRFGDTWSQRAYIKSSNSGYSDLFGSGLALSADGGVLAVTAHNEDSAATGINGNQDDDSASDSGAVYLY